MYSEEEREQLRKDILFTDEAAELLEISKQAFHKHIKNERIIPLKTSNRITIYLKEDVLKLKEELKEGRKRHLPYIFNDENERI
ncbi:DNA-binding protein [Metabacillus fastidiosus]|uniref:DNA-binding protein n=1 Tax=Metabacillus fastidiosus TaxID=1458 RepID=UPI003D2CF210